MFVLIRKKFKPHFLNLKKKKPNNSFDNERLRF